MHQCINLAGEGGARFFLRLRDPGGALQVQVQQARLLVRRVVAQDPEPLARGHGRDGQG